MAALVQIVMALTLIWNHVEVITVGFAVFLTIFPLTVKFHHDVAGEILHAQATAPTSGKTVLFTVTHLGDSFLQLGWQFS